MNWSVITLWKIQQVLYSYQLHSITCHREFEIIMRYHKDCLGSIKKKSTDLTSLRNLVKKTFSWLDNEWHQGGGGNVYTKSERTVNIYMSCNAWKHTRNSFDFGNQMSGWTMRTARDFIYFYIFKTQRPSYFHIKRMQQRQQNDTVAVCYWTNHLQK